MGAVFSDKVLKDFDQSIAAFFREAIVTYADEPVDLPGQRRLPADPAVDVFGFLSTPVLQSSPNDIRVGLYENGDHAGVPLFGRIQVLAGSIDDDVQSLFHPVFYFPADTII